MTTAFGVSFVAILLLILLNGVLAMSEIALVAARHSRLRQRAARGDRGARAALELVGAPARFLATVQIGITLVGVLAGALGEASIAVVLERRLGNIAVLAPYARAFSLSLVVLGVTYLSLIVGELVPKRLAMLHAEALAGAVAPVMRALSRVAAPVVRILTISTDVVLRLLRQRVPVEPSVTEEDIRLMIDQGMQAGVVEPLERELLERVFRLGDRRVTALMTPRTEVVALDITDPAAVVRRKLFDSGHARFPLVRGSLDRVLGLVRARDVVGQLLDGLDPDLQAMLQPALFVPEGMTGLKVLQRFKDTGSQMAVVIDEFGGCAGLVTANDLLEAIVGDLPLPEEMGEPPIVRRADGSWLVDGRASIDDVKRLLGIERLPREDSAEYETLGGLVMTLLGRVPISGDRVEVEGVRLEVVDMDGRRVDKVLIVPAGTPSTS
jgi:putative hemolysin